MNKIIYIFFIILYYILSKNIKFNNKYIFIQLKHIIITLKYIYLINIFQYSHKSFYNFSAFLIMKIYNIN
jgi:hypothetical protein